VSGAYYTITSLLVLSTNVCNW